MYYIVNWTQSKDSEGYEPNIPVGMDFCLIVDNRFSPHSWGVFEFSIDDDEEYTRVGKPLKAMLNSVSKYPPAYAISKLKMENESQCRAFTKKEFESKFCEVIEQSILEARDRKYVFSKAVNEECGYLVKGEYYWILSASFENHDHVVRWISDDNFIYRNKASYFSLSEEELNVLLRNA